MSWHATWASSQISNNDLKYLLSDLCIATNERYRIGKQADKTFPVQTGSVAQPATTDIEGLPISADGSTNDLKELLEAIVAAIKDMVPEFYTSSACTTAYTWSSACSAVGMYSTTDTEDVQKFRERNWWLNLQAILKLLRYKNFPAPHHFTGDDESHSDTTLEGGPNDPGFGYTNDIEAIWDSIGSESSSGWVSPGVGYYMTGGYLPSGAKKYYNTEAESASTAGYEWDTDYFLWGFSRTYPPSKSACVWTSVDIGISGDIDVYVGESPPSLPSISGNFAGESWSGTPNTTVTINLASADPDGSSNVTTTIPSTCPSLYPTTPTSGGVGGDGFYFYVIAGVDSIMCGFDLNSSYGFQA